jgi:hypothetical protein
MGGGKGAAFSPCGEGGDVGVAIGMAREEEIPEEEVPFVERRVGDGGDRTEVEFEDSLAEDVSLDDDEVRVIDAFWPEAADLFPFSPVFSVLVLLFVSIAADKGSNASDTSSPLLNVAHAHSSATVKESIDFALHPAPTPSTASLGLSCSLNSSQFAYTHFNNQ